MGRRQKEKIEPIPSSHTDARRRLNKSIFIIIGLMGLLAIVLVRLTNYGNTGSASTVVVDPNTLAGIQSGEAPWQPELSHLRERLSVIGLPALPEEGSALHIHQHLDIFIHGKSVPVPAAIGFNVVERFLSPIHTHEANGVIHIESPSVQKFTLGQFFDIWGVRFTSKCIGSYCEDQQNSLKAFVNGKAGPGDPRLIELTDHPEIVITYGMSSELPIPIPSQYQFPPGS